VTAPPAGGPLASKPGAAQPGAAPPWPALPGAAQPGAAQPGAAQPGPALPGAAPPWPALPGAALAGVTLVRAAYGAALCCAPGPMLRLSGGPGAAASPGARAVARVLGGRHIVQAVLSAARPTPAVLALGAGADVLHSASMIVLAALDRPRRRLGLSDGLVAAAFAGAGWALAGYGRAGLAPAPEAAALPSLP
jgi:hypothetical protein